MKLAPESKLIIAMLCDMARDKTERVLNYPLIESMLQYEDKWEVDWSYFINELGRYDFEKTRLVVDVLDMCLMIKQSSDVLTADDLAEFLDFNDEHPFIFYGFCHQEEAEYYAIEQIYMNHVGYYGLLKKDGYEVIHSLGPKIPRYLRMLKVYKRWINAYPNAKRLSKDALIELVSI